MHYNISDLNGYIALIFDGNPWEKLDLQPQTDDTFFSACCKHLLSPANRFVLLRYFKTRSFYSAIKKECLFASVRLKLHPFSKGYAYMLDCGEIHIGADLLFRSNQITFVSVLLHEFAHIVLSQIPSYDSLLKLDRCFAERFFEGQHNELLKTITPVELYAQSIADLWLTELAERIPDEQIKTLLLREVSKSHEKLTAAISLLKDIK